jgi:diacylglycerol kinase (ATP)
VTATAENLKVHDKGAGAARHVLLVVNATAGRRTQDRSVANLTEALEDSGFRVQRIASLDALSPQAGDALRCGQLRAVIAAGGDGTVAEVVNRTAPETPIAVYPLGTENLLAKYLQMGRDPAKFAQMIAEGHTVALDTGRANGRVFLLMAGVGFDAEVVRRLHESRNGHISHLTYFKPILDSIRSYNYPELRVYCAPDEKESAPIRCRFAFVFNLPKYAGGLPIAPAADGTDGVLDLCTFERGGLTSGLRYLAAVVLGVHERLREVTSWRGQQLRIESDQPVPYELDGDAGGILPLTIEVVPRRLRVFVSPNWKPRARQAAQ